MANRLLHWSHANACLVAELLTSLTAAGDETLSEYQLLSFLKEALATFEALALISTAIRIFFNPFKPHSFGNDG